MVVTSSNDINEVCQKFYKDLYKSIPTPDTEETETYLLSHMSKKNNWMFL